MLAPTPTPPSMTTNLTNLEKHIFFKNQDFRLISAFCLFLWHALKNICMV